MTKPLEPPATGDAKAIPDVPKPAPPTPKGDEKLGDAGYSALVKERENVANLKRELAEAKQSIEDSKKSAEQLAADALAKAQAELAASQARVARYDVAAELGIDIKLAGRLVGATREELLADGEELKALLGAAKDPEDKQKQKMAPNPAAMGAGDPPIVSGLQAGRDAWRKRHGESK